MPFLTPTVAHMAKLRKPVWVRVSKRKMRLAPRRPRELSVTLRNVEPAPLKVKLSATTDLRGLNVTPATQAIDLASGQEVTRKLRVSTTASEGAGTISLLVEAAGKRKHAEVSVRVTANLVRIEVKAKDGSAIAPVVISNGYATTPRGRDFSGTPRPTDGKTGGSVTWQMTAPSAGEYVLMADVWWVDAKGNSWYVSVDGGQETTFGNDPVYGRWHWVTGPTYRLAAGRHTIRFHTREDGARVRQVALTNDTE